MSQLYQEFANEYLFWVIAGVAGVAASIEYYKTKSWGKTFSALLLGAALSWGVTSIPVVKDLAGRIIMWIISFLKF